MGNAGIALVIGGLLTFAGGIYVAVYNFRWHDVFGDNKRVWGGPNGSVADCAVASGVFGVLAALVGLVGFVFVMFGLPNMLTTIVFIASLVLYFGEMIPEAVLVNKTKYGGTAQGSYFYLINHAKQSVRFEGDDDFVDWYMGAYDRLSAYNKPEKLTEGAIKDIEWLEGVVGSLPGYYVLDRWGVATCDRSGEYLSEAGGMEFIDLDWESKHKLFYTEICVKEEFPVKYRASGMDGDFVPCVIDYNSTVLDLHREVKDESGSSSYELLGDCDKINVVAECRGRWSEGLLTKYAKKECKAEQEPRLDERLEKKELTAEEYLDELVSSNNEVAKEKAKAKFIGVDSLNEHNKIIISIQTVAFFITALGVVLSFIGGSSAVSGVEP